jgi:hypothetical protein
VPFHTLTAPGTKLPVGPVTVLTFTAPVTKLAVGPVAVLTLTGLITFIVREGVLTPPVSLLALITNVKLPTAVGVPVIAPVDAFSDSPGGKVPELTA